MMLEYLVPHCFSNFLLTPNTVCRCANVTEGELKLPEGLESHLMVCSSLQKQRWKTGLLCPCLMLKYQQFLFCYRMELWKDHFFATFVSVYHFTLHPGSAESLVSRVSLISVRAITYQNILSMMKNTPVTILLTL